MKKNNQILMTALFLIFLVFISVFNLFSPSRRFSDNENRVLEQFPTFSFKKMFFEDYTSDLETWFSDQFMGRDGWIVLKAMGERAMGKIENKGVFFGKDNQLIAQFDLVDQHRLISNIDLVNKLSEKVTVPISLMLVPTAAQIKKQSLPLFAYNTDQIDLLDKIQAYLQDSSLLWVDVKSQLVQGEAVENKNQPLYFKTDHHWTAYGAYLGYQAYMNSLARQPLVLGKDLHYTCVSTDFKGTQYSKAGAFWQQGEELVIFESDKLAGVEVEYDQTKEIHNSLFNLERLTQKDQYTVYLDGNHARVDITSKVDNHEKLLIIKDSYAHVLAPYLAAHFSHIVMVDLRYYHSSISKLIESENIDRVLFLYSLDNFSTDTNLGFLK